MSLKGMLTEMLGGEIVAPAKCPGCGEFKYGLDMSKGTGCDKEVWGMCSDENIMKRKDGQKLINP